MLEARQPHPLPRVDVELSRKDLVILDHVLDMFDNAYIELQLRLRDAYLETWDNPKHD